MSTEEKGEQLPDMPDDWRCPVCLDILVKPLRMKTCHHLICAACCNRMPSSMRRTAAAIDGSKGWLRTLKSSLRPSQESQVQCPMCRGFSKPILDVGLDTELKGSPHYQRKLEQDWSSSDAGIHNKIASIPCIQTFRSWGNLTTDPKASKLLQVLIYVINTTNLHSKPISCVEVEQLAKEFKLFYVAGYEDSFACNVPSTSCAIDITFDAFGLRPTTFFLAVMP